MAEKGEKHVYNRVFNEEDWKKVNKDNKALMEDYLIELKATKHKPSSISQYKNDLRIVMIYCLKQCDNRSMTELSKKDFRNFVLYCTDELGVSNARVNRLMSAVRTMLEFASNEDDYDYEVNQAGKVKGLPKEGIRDIVWLSADTCEKLHNYFIENKMYKDNMLFSLALESSARRNELLQVKKDTITDERNNTNIVVMKRGKKNPLIYFDWTKEAAKLYLAERGEDDNPMLFVNANKETMTADGLYEMVVKWRPIIKSLTGEDVEINVHSMRHTALQLYSTGEHEVCKSKGMGAIPINKLKNIARHSDISTTQGYLISDEQGELEEMFGFKFTD